MSCWTRVIGIAIFKDNKWVDLEHGFRGTELGGGRDLYSGLQEIGEYISETSGEYSSTWRYKLIDLLKVYFDNLHREDSKEIPNLSWIIEELIPLMEEHKILPSEITIDINYD